MFKFFLNVTYNYVILQTYNFIFIAKSHDDFARMNFIIQHLLLIKY